MANRLDFEGKPKNRGVQVAQQAVTDRGFLFEQILQLPQIDLRTGSHFQHPEMTLDDAQEFATDGVEVDGIA